MMTRPDCEVVERAADVDDCGGGGGAVDSELGPDVPARPRGGVADLRALTEATAAGVRRPRILEFDRIDDDEVVDESEAVDDFGPSALAVCEWGRAGVRGVLPTDGEAVR